MTKLVALYRTPPDKEAFDKRYFDVHLPIVAKIPGLRRTEITRLKSLGGEDKFYIQAELFFDNTDAFNESMSSPEGKAAASDVMSFAKDLVIMMIGEVQE